MEKSIFEQMGGSYHQQGDYFLPNLTAPESVSVGVWGQRHLRYIKEHRKALYIGLQLSGELDSYLADTDKQAADMFSQLIRQIANQRNINEQLKVTDQMEWVRQMNSIVEQVVEIVNAELIYV